LTDCSIKSK